MVFDLIKMPTIFQELFYFVAVFTTKIDSMSKLDNLYLKILKIKTSPPAVLNLYQSK